MGEFGYPAVGNPEYGGIGNEGVTPYGVPAVTPPAIYVPVIWSAAVVLNYGLWINVVNYVYGVEV